MTLSRLRHILTIALPAAGCMLVLAGIGMSMWPAKSPVAVIIHTRASVSAAPSPGASATPASNPAVAGASTSKPPASTKPPLMAPAPGVNTPFPVSLVTLELDSGTTSSYHVNYHSGMDACSILTEAQAEHQIASVSISDKYLHASPLNSQFVESINGQPNWNFYYNGVLSPVGCTKVLIHPGDTVKWKHA